MPCAPTGLWMCAASPSRKHRRSRNRAARRWLMRYIENQLHDSNASPAPASFRSEGSSASKLRSSRARSVRRHDPDQPPVIRAAHREEEMKAVAPEVDVELVRHHRAGDDGVGDEEDVLVGRPGEVDPGQVAHRAVRAVAAGDPLCLDLPHRAVREFELRGYARGSLRQVDQLGVPFHADAPAAEGLSEQPLVVVLAEDQEKGIRAQIAPDVAEGDACCARFPPAQRFAPVARLPSSSALSTIPRWA